MSSNTFSNSLNSSETQTRYLQTRIDTFEKHLLDIHTSLCSYTRKIARTRDEGDLFASNLLQFAESEKIDTSLRSGLSNFANCLTAIQDFRNEEVTKIEEKVLNEISICGESTRRAKEELRVNSIARNKQLSDHKEGKIKEIGRSASFNEFSGVFKAYELQVQRFEIKKLCDIKKLLLDFTKYELLFHTKTIEMLTKAFKEILSIDEESDLQEFCAFFNFTQLGSPKNESSFKSSDNERMEMSSTLRRFNSTPNFNSPAKQKCDIEKDNQFNEYESDSDTEDNYSLKGIKSER